MLGSIDAAFYSLLGGINVGEEVTVKPYFAAEINHVKCRTRVHGGEIFVEWRRTDEGVRLRLSSDERVRLILPDGRVLFEKECKITVKYSDKHALSHVIGRVFCVSTLFLPILVIW